MKGLMFTFSVFLIANIGFTDDMPSEVKRLKTIRDKKVEEIDRAYFRELDKLKKKYTVNGNYTAAAYVEKMKIAYIDAEEGERKENGTPTLQQNPTEHVGTNAKVYSKDKFVRFKRGVKARNDKGENSIAFGNIPEKYEGWMITAVATTSETPLEFKVKEAGIVTLVVEIFAKNHLEQQGWNIVAKAQLSNRANLSILQKHLDAGEYTIEDTRESWLGTRLLKCR